MLNRLKLAPDPGTACAVLTEITWGFERISFLKARILLRISLFEFAVAIRTCSLLNPRSLLRRYFSWPYIIHVQVSIIIEIENWMTTKLRRRTTLLDPFERLPFKTLTGLNFER